jgi:hypothetical protein
VVLAAGDLAGYPRCIVLGLLARRWLPLRRHAAGNGPSGRLVDRRRQTCVLDAPRSGAPRTIDDERVEAVVAKALESVPKGATHWSTRLMKERSASASQVTASGHESWDISLKNGHFRSALRSRG